MCTGTIGTMGIKGTIELLKMGKTSIRTLMKVKKYLQELQKENGKNFYKNLIKIEKYLLEKWEQWELQEKGGNKNKVER